MRYSKLSIGLALALLCAGCGRRAAVTATPAPAAARAAAESSTAQADPDAQCKSWGIEPGSPGYKQCVDGMTEAANAAANDPKCVTVTRGANTSTSCP